MPINDTEVMLAARDALPSWSWDDFAKEPPQTVELMRLDPNEWHALIAYLAGPSWVYQEPARYDPVDETGRVRRGDASTAGAFSGDADVTGDHDEMARYLVDAGVPEPPRGVQWMLCLPDGVTEWELEHACRLAVQNIDPADRRRSALEVHAALRVLLNGRMTPLSW